MTDHDNIPTETESETETAFEKETIKRLGQRGSSVLEREQKTTDLEGMDEQVDATVVPFCTCGTPVTEITDVYRCHSCDRICCSACRIQLSRRTSCPACAEHEYNMTKQVFLTLYLLNESTIDITDLFTTETADTGQVTVTIDTAVTTLLTHNYLRTVNPDTPAQDTANAVTIADDDPLSVAGKEALHVGEQLYSDDPDVETLKEQLEIQQVANNDR